jgi:hypothetical protein
VRRVILYVAAMSLVQCTHEVIVSGQVDGIPEEIELVGAPCTDPPPKDAGDGG